MAEDQPDQPQPEQPEQQTDWWDGLVHYPYGHETEGPAQGMGPHMEMTYREWAAQRVAAYERGALERPLLRVVDLGPEGAARMSLLGRGQLRAWRVAFWHAMHQLGFICLHDLHFGGADGNEVHVLVHAGPQATDVAKQGMPEPMWCEMVYAMHPHFPSLN